MMPAPVKQTVMTLGRLLDGIVTIPASLDCELNYMSADSREVSEGSLFVALRGQRVNGATYIDEAIARGATAILREMSSDEVAVTPLSWQTSKSGKIIPLVAITDLSDKLGMLADRFYASPSADLFVVGITGTNGKTSCSQFVAQSLSQEQLCGVIGTLGRGLYGHLKASGHTTPDVIANHHWLATMRNQGASSVIMEVSSHALDQRRVDNIRFDCAVFTNLTHEHLDYHGDMASYAAVKQKLFHMPGLRTAVVNQDDPYGRELLSVIGSSMRVISYGTQKEYSPQLLAENIEALPQGLRFVVKSSLGDGQLESRLLGNFNVSNLLAALGVLLGKGMDFDKALERLSRVSTVSGRMEAFGGGELPLVVIDYAHTPDALRHVLGALREHTRGTLWCVFGCGGERDRQKRPLMGQIAEQYADRVVVTNDNPRHENPVDIIEQILAGMTAPDRAYIERDRQRAIEAVVQGATLQDVVLIAGKGHENYQIIDDDTRPFSDMAEVQLQLKRLKA